MTRALALNHLAGADVQASAVSSTCAAGVLASHRAGAGVRCVVRLGARPTALPAVDRLPGRCLRRARPPIAPRAASGRAMKCRYLSKATRRVEGPPRWLADPGDAADDLPISNLGTHVAGPVPATEWQR